MHRVGTLMVWSQPVKSLMGFVVLVGAVSPSFWCTPLVHGFSSIGKAFRASKLVLHEQCWFSVTYMYSMLKGVSYMYTRPTHL